MIALYGSSLVPPKFVKSVLSLPLETTWFVLWNSPVDTMSCWIHLTMLASSGSELHAASIIARFRSLRRSAVRTRARSDILSLIDVPSGLYVRCPYDLN